MVALAKAGKFSINGAAPPPSRKFIEVPTVPPPLEERRAPSKYGRRSTSVPLKVPFARIPGTVIPTFGLVSA